MAWGRLMCLCLSTLESNALSGIFVECTSRYIVWYGRGILRARYGVRVDGAGGAGEGYMGMGHVPHTCTVYMYQN